MKGNIAKIMLISISALLLLFSLLVNFQPGTPASLQTPKKEINIDVVIEKVKTAKTKPASKLKPKPISQPTSKISQTSPPVAPAKPNSIANGALPPVSANYRTHLGFRRYAAEMRKHGARFYVFGGAKKQIYEIDFSSRSLKRVSPPNIVSQNFSPRTRVIEDEPALDFFRKLAAEEYKLNNPEVILLLPQAMENKIAAALTANNINAAEFDAFRGIYHLVSGNLALRINEGITLSGKKQLDIEIYYNQ